jgi:uncharacterized lipoprotein YbaY
VKATPLLLVVLLLAGCPEDTPPPPVPVEVDAPELASSLRWVGVCAVICSSLGAAALIIASSRRK